MRIPLVIAPIAVLGTACTIRPFTPSTTLVTWSQHVPEAIQQTLPSADQAIARWQLPPDSIWSRFSKNTLLSSLDSQSMTGSLPEISRLEVVHQAQCAAQHVAARGLPAGTMWIVDMRGAASVAFGAMVSRLAREPVAPIATFNNWPAESEAVPAEETLAAMLAIPPQIPAPGTEHAVPILLLDAWRLAFRYEEVGEDVVDNRYALTSADVPSAELLIAQGIHRVVYLVERLDETDVEEDDMTAIVADYAAHGIELSMVDLPSLCEPPSPSLDVGAVIAHHPWRFMPRRTLLDEPTFYQRARSGFGAVHSGPSPFRGGGGFSMVGSTGGG